MDNKTVFYVSLAGDDRWSGRLAEPTSQKPDGPFATLTRARQAVRELRTNGNLPGPVTIKIRAGKYYLAEPFLLGPEDGGTQECPVTYCAYEGEKLIITGCKSVKGWKTYRDQIMVCSLPGSRGGKWKFRQLFYKDQRQQQARWPRLDPANPVYGGWAFMEGPASPGSSTVFRYKPGTFAHHYAKPAELEAHYWYAQGQWPCRVPVSAMDEEQRTVTLVHGGLQFDVPGWYQVTGFSPDNRFIMLNGLEDVQAPGDWCFDSEEGLLYFWPPDSDLRAVGVDIPFLDCLVDVRGANWVNLVGLTFTGTLDGDNYHHEGVEGAGAMYPHPGWRYGSDAVHLKDAEHCRVKDCLFDAVGCNGIYLESHNARHLIDRNEFRGAGANAICLMGTRLKHPIFNIVCNNDIHDCGVFNQYTAGIFLGMSDGNLIRHNRLQRLPHHAINLSNSPFGRNVVEYNEIRFTDQEVNDSGAINCWMEEPPDKNVQRCGHVIRFNLIADTYACTVVDGKVVRGVNTFSNGIYLDNYTSNCFVYGNIVVRAATAGIVIHAGKNNLIENNLLVDCQCGLRPQDYISTLDFWKPMTGFMTGNHFVHNIIASRLPGAQVIFLYNSTERTFTQCDENLYFVPNGAYQIIDETSPDPKNKVRNLSAWQKLGYDLHTLTADPQIIDLEHDDFRLADSSPAFDLGFVAIDLAKIGIQNK
jgi:parallel beta-helix repeat protein